MRWFSRLGSWLRSDTDPSDLDAVQEELFDAFAPPGPSPQTAPDRFVAALLRAIDTSIQHDQAEVYRLDPTVQVLVIPPGVRVADAREDKLHEDIDRAILELGSNGRSLSSLTWSALRDARPSFAPSYLEWSKSKPERFEGSVGLVFFLDLEAIAHAAGQAAQSLGFSTRFSAERPAVIVDDGRFEAHIGINALIAEALWTARGPAAMIQKRSRALPSEFRTFQAVASGLARRFAGASVRHEDSHLTIEIAGTRSTVDYRHLSASVRAAGLSVDGFLGRVTLLDIVRDHQEPGIVLRSRNVLKAWPDALYDEQEGAQKDREEGEKNSGYVLLAIRQADDGRQRIVTRASDDPEERFEHYRAEADRQIGFTQFSAHATVFEEDGYEGVVVIGDRIASVFADRRLVRGLLEALTLPPLSVRFLAFSEDEVIILPVIAAAPTFMGEDGPPLPPPDVPKVVFATLLDEAKRRRLLLAEDLLPDGADALDLDQELTLGDLSAGSFEIDFVDDIYFLYRDQSTTQDFSFNTRKALLRGLAMRTLGRVPEAIQWFEQAFRVDRGDGEVALVLGQAHFSMGDCTAALPFLERAHDLLPQSAEAANALGLGTWGIGQTAEAAAAFERAVQLEPTETTFLVNLGRSYVDGHQFSRARACLERALRLEPDSAEAHASMALLCHRQGDPRGARRHAREALAEQPDDQKIRKLLSTLDD